jgi:GntR family transcriptional regulator
MHIAVNATGELPIYRQIMRQIVEAIAAGRLEAGEKLPSHRDLSEQIVVAPLTVKKAYDELEALGYIETQRGRGTFVRAKLPRTNRTAQIEHLREQARQLLTQAYLAGLGLPEVMELLGTAGRELDRGPAKTMEKR